MVPIETWKSMAEGEMKEQRSFLSLDKKQQGHLVPQKGKGEVIQIQHKELGSVLIPKMWN